LNEARIYVERALRIVETSYGEDHPSIATCSNNLGTILRDLGDLGGARTYIERAFRIASASYGPDHPNTKLFQRNLNDLGPP